MGRRADAGRESFEGEGAFLGSDSDARDRDRGASPADAHELLSLARIHVAADRLGLEVALSPDAPRMTDASIARAVLERFPSVVRHTCINAHGPTFASVIESTSIPHLLEHLIIDLQVAEPATASDATFTGITTWIDEAAGIARVEVSYRDDLVAMAAVNRALAFLNALLA